MKISISKITKTSRGHSHQRPKVWGKKDRCPTKDRRCAKAELRRFI